MANTRRSSTCCAGSASIASRYRRLRLRSPIRWRGPASGPGGLYIIADHSGPPGTGISESGTLHRIEEAFLRQEVEAAGFKLLEKGNFLRNPNDPRDKNIPDRPQPKDEFVLKFVKS